MVDRDFVLNRLKSRVLSQEEFNYDILSAPPISSMFTQDDIEQLYYIATSAKYSSKLKEKYKMIDDIMRNRGFEKLVSGTNRTSYVPTFADGFIVKVAYDSVAIEDSIREFKNQFLIKPFCTKVFEVSPNGVLGVFERVIPITNRKEYISMAADIFLLLSEFLTGEYLIDDIGTEYFNNIGYRRGFGPVVLDFPYMYQVDPKKIWCTKADYNDPTGYCNGAIDYDLGFNKLRCKKCGAIYKPWQLAKKKIEYPNAIINEREEIHMKFYVTGGTLGSKRVECNTGDFMNPVHAIESKILSKKIDKTLEEEKKEEEEKTEEKTVNGIPTPKAEEDESEERGEPTSPIVFNDDLADLEPGEDPGYADDNKSDIGELLSKICNLYYYSDTSKEDQEKIVKECCNYLKDIFKDNIEVAIKMFADILRKKNNIKDEVIAEFLDKNSCLINNQFLKILLSSGNYTIIPNVEGCELDKDNNLVFSINSSIYKPKSSNKGKKNEMISVCQLKDFNATISKDIIESALHKDEDDEFYDSEKSKGLDLAKGFVMSKKDLFPNESFGKIIVVKNDDDTYLTLNNRILAINCIDDRDLDDLAVVSKDWYENAVEKIELLKEAPVGSLPEEDEEVPGEE